MVEERKTKAESKSIEIEGRVTALEVGQQAIQEDIRELTRVVTDLAHETRRSLSVIQRPNWQYMAVLLGVVLAIGNVYMRDQNKQEDSIKELSAWRMRSSYEAGVRDGTTNGLSEQIQILRSEIRDLPGGR